MVKLIKVVINIHYEMKDLLMTQYFDFVVDNKKHYCYFWDSRFYLMKRIANIISNEDISCDVIVYNGRTDKEDGVEVQYICTEKVVCPSSIIKIVDFFLPPAKSCKYCIYQQTSEGFDFCLLKKKLIDKHIKTCKVFKQKEV
jgi:hypothetical protein